MQTPLLQQAQQWHRGGRLQSKKSENVSLGTVNGSSHVLGRVQQQERIARQRVAETLERSAQSSSWRQPETTLYASPIPTTPRTASALIPVPLREVEAEHEALRPLPLETENLADDPSLHNPLQRSERMSTNWFGVVMEYDGVVVEDTSDLQRKAWLKTAELEGKKAPPLFLLQRAEGMKNEQVIREVFCWTREPMEVRRIVERKENVLTEILGDMQPLISPEFPKFMESLASNKVPAVLATSAPEKRVKPALQSLGIEKSFEGLVSAEDTYRGRPDPEPYLLAAQMMKRPHARCVVVGNSNQTVEAAKECGMAAVVVAGRKPLYELGAADLVVKHLGEIKIINLQQLFRNEDLVVPAQEVETEKEENEEDFDSYEDTSLW